jgi:Mlc titration factor MtfA (ptsG expression regulator)
LSFRSNTLSRETKTDLVLRHQHRQARSGESWTSGRRWAERSPKMT